MVIIVTGTIAPSNNVGQLTLVDSDQRLKQYINSLNIIVEQRPDASIIFCDNSGYGLGAFDELKKKAESRNIPIELFSFKGDDSNVIKYGKGYGEGEILKYVFKNSKLIERDDYIVKITGRLVIDNICDILKRIDKNCIYFNVPNIHRRDMYDTRFYAMPKAIFEKYFIDEYPKVNDEKGYYLEVLYTDIVIGNSLKAKNFPRYPRIVGISGTGGITYSYTEWKTKIKDVLSMINVYGRIKKQRT